jgi:hypothetical protein
MNFENLVKMFPSMKVVLGERAWNAHDVLRWLCSVGGSHGEVLAARFLLGVWNQQADWVTEARELGFPSPEAAKRFDLIDAVTVWDEPHLAALRAWLAAPFFP